MPVQEIKKSHAREVAEDSADIPFKTVGAGCSTNISGFACRLHGRTWCDVHLCGRLVPLLPYFEVANSISSRRHGVPFFFFS